MKLLLELSGEHEELPKAEMESVLKGEKIKYKIIEEIKEKRILLAEVKTKNLKFLKRLALTKKVAEFITKEEEISKLAEKVYEKISEKKTFAVRSSSQRIEKELGEHIKNLGLEVNLRNPNVEVLCFHVSGKYYVGISIPLKRDFEKRKPQFRPYFSPTSMHPKLARTLINLARVKKGNKILDPFCGTGGILIESALIEMDAMGIDFDERAVEGCKKNLNFYGLKGEIKKGNALKVKLKEKVDAIVTDLPYGRSSFVTEKNLEDFYQNFLLAAYRNLKSKGHLVMVIPEGYELISTDGFSLEGTYKIYVHKSLSRKIFVLRKIK